MAKRRSLVSGIKAPPRIDPEKEQAFIYGGKELERTPRKKPSRPKSESSEPVSTTEQVSELPKEQVSPSPVGKSPLSTRLRSDVAAALKRASLERQLQGIAPNSVQDILEEALESWLKSNAYLK